MLFIFCCYKQIFVVITVPKHSKPREAHGIQAKACQEKEPESHLRLQLLHRKDDSTGKEEAPIFLIE